MVSPFNWDFLYFLFLPDSLVKISNTKSNKSDDNGILCHPSFTFDILVIILSYAVCFGIRIMLVSYIVLESISSHIIKNNLSKMGISSSLKFICKAVWSKVFFLSFCCCFNFHTCGLSHL